MDLGPGTISKILILVIVFMVAGYSISKILVEESPTMSTFSPDGYKDLSRGESVYVIRQDKTVKSLALLLPDKFEKNFSIRLTYPAIFGKGMRRLTVTAKDNDLHISKLETRPFDYDPYPEKRFNLPICLDGTDRVNTGGPQLRQNIGVTVKLL